MSFSDDTFDLGCTMMRAQADAMQMGDEQGRHARALRRLMRDCDRAIKGLAKALEMPPNDAAWALVEDHYHNLLASLAEAREAVDG